VNQRSDDATALVGMPDLVVNAQVLRDGEWWLAVETQADRVWCPGCGVRAVGHGRSPTQVRDLSIAGTPTVLVFARRRWRCAEPLCPTATWSEQIGAIAARASLTERARCRLAEMVNIEGFSIAAAAVEFGVGWHTANAAVTDHTDPHIEDQRPRHRAKPPSSRRARSSPCYAERAGNATSRPAPTPSQPGYAATPCAPPKLSRSHTARPRVPVWRSSRN
jgi:hypothetical protein